MNNRRKFLMQGSVAATILLFKNPFEAIAGMTSTMSLNIGNSNQITFLHTANNSNRIAKQLSGLTVGPKQIMMIHAGTKPVSSFRSITYDASPVPDENALNKNYKIVNKNGIKTGVITILAHEANKLNMVNKIASDLKKRHGCNVVVVISHLGFYNKNKRDDKELAAKSEHIDLIISKYNTKMASQTFIASNKNSEEVIIQHHSDEEADAGKMTLQLNSKGEKCSVSF